MNEKTEKIKELITTLRNIEATMINQENEVKTYTKNLSSSLELYKSKIDIIEKYSKEAPVNLVGIANDFGIAIHASNLGSQVAGVIKKDDKLGGFSGYVILVNQNDAPYRQRFTIAHELSHFILHKFFIGDGIQEDPLYRSGLSNTMERQANRLAANILMPLSLVKQLLKDYNHDIAVIAKKLEVSKKALEILLSSNRLIQI